MPADQKQERDPQRPRLTAASIRALPSRDRIPFVERMQVRYPRAQAIQDEIARCHQMAAGAAEPPCALIVGPTGAGKTTQINSYVSKYPAVLTETGTHRPVVKATIPSPASIKGLETTLLAALGDPRAGKGTVGTMELRLIQYLRDCGVEMLILDELQHFVDRESHKILMGASNWFKTIIKEAKVACILVGLQGEAEQVVDANEQLARLFGDPLILAPFEWDRARPETIREFCAVLKQLEALLPLRETTGLTRGDLAWRCFVASDGLISYLMALVRRATHLALLQGHEHLDEALLAEAFNQRLAGLRRQLPNPFIGELPGYLAAPERIHPPRTVRATGNRSRARRDRPESTQDILRQ